LVGASRGYANKIPFIVGYSTEPQRGIPTTCTGSLIGRQWVLSAAHCIIYYVQDRKYDDCARKQNNYESGRVSCDWLPGGNLKIKLNPPGIAYLGTVDVNNQTHKNRGYKVEIDFAVKHNLSYLAGGTYGDFGGYDIALIHLATPTPTEFKSACLPGPQFKDAAIGPAFKNTEKANLAGFGKYTREPCMTNEFGPAKYHYCAGSSLWHNNVNPCKSGLAPTSKYCEKYSPKLKNIFKKYSQVQEVIVIDSSGKKHYCYRRQNPTWIGWCNVKEDASAIGELRQTTSWGFCSKDCNIEDAHHTPSSSVLRTVKGVDILPSGLCDHYLDIALGHNVKVRPEILCIGYLKDNKYIVMKEANGTLVQLTRRSIVHSLQASSGIDGIVHSAGTCNGDSGGPVFIKHDKTKKYVVLGVVSGGRGVLSNCGGLNNPTHYARVKKFGQWIRQVLGQEDSKELCFIQK